MKQSRAPLFTHHYLVWPRLAWKITEMMLASAQVIHQRTIRMAAAGATPSARDRREFALMGQEKLEAGVESGRALVAQLLKMNPLLGPLAFEHMMRGAAAAMSLAASRTTGQAVARHAKLLRTMTQSAGTAARASVATARLVQHGLAPIHSRAMANAKRLGRR